MVYPNNEQEQSDAGADEPRSVIDALRRIRNGSLDPASLSVESRRACVAHLTAEGLSAPEIAEALHTSERTVARDRAAVRDANAVELDDGFTSRTIGNLLSRAEQSSQRLRRLARDREAPVAVRIEAERAAWRVDLEMAEQLRRMGWLPSATHVVQADVTHHVGPAQLNEVCDEADRLAGILSDARPEDREGLARISRIRDSAHTLVQAAPADDTTDESLAKEGEHDEE